MTSKEHREACQTCKDYPRYRCPDLQVILENEAIASVQRMYQSQSEDLRAGIRIGMEMRFAAEGVMRSPPRCKLMLHMFGPPMAEPACAFCGYRPSCEKCGKKNNPRLTPAGAWICTGCRVG